MCVCTCVCTCVRACVHVCVCVCVCARRYAPLCKLVGSTATMPTYVSAQELTFEEEDREQVDKRGCMVPGVGCRVQSVGCRVQGVGCCVQGAWCRV